MNIAQLLEVLGVIKPTYLGVDLAPSSAILVKLTQYKENIQLSQLQVVELPINIFSDGHIIQPRDLGRLLNKQLAHSGNNYSVIAASTKMVTTHRVNVTAHGSDIKQELKILDAAEKIFPNIYNDLYLDYTEIPASEEEHEPEAGTKNFLIIAAHKNAIQDQMETLMVANLPVKILDVDYFAIERCYHLLKNKLNPAETAGFVGILEMSPTRLLLTVFHKNKRIHSSHHGLQIRGLNELTQFYLNNLEHNPQKLVELKLKSAQLSESQNELLINQLTYTLSSFKPDDPNQKIARLFVSGRVALIPGITELITNFSGITAELANPFLGLINKTQLSPELLQHYAPTCVLACGLAMRNINYDEN